jgi:hypothetical protein
MQNEKALNNNEEDKRTEYKIAIDLMIKEENSFWNQFNALLLANSIFIGAIALASSERMYSSYKFVMSTIGIIFCLLWFSISIRRDAYRIFYLYKAKQIESYLSNNSNIFSDGELFYKGEKVRFHLKDTSKISHQLPFVGKLRGPKWSLFIIGGFITIYLYLLFYHCFVSCFLLCQFGVIITTYLASVFLLYLVSGITKSNSNDDC